jgi:tRNA1(Val) A37 N6-methylase TrmN6
MQKMTKLEQQQEKKREIVEIEMDQAQQEYTQTSIEVSKMQQQMSEIQASAELLEQQVCAKESTFSNRRITLIIAP